MNCKLCGASMVDGAQFCPQCGTRVTAPPAPQPRCACCTSPLLAGAKFCSVCGTACVPPSPQPTAYVPFAPAAAEAKIPSAPKKSKLPVILVILAIVAVIGILVAGFLTDWFGLAAGADKEDAQKEDQQADFFLEDNFTLEFELDLDGDTIDGTAMVDLNWKQDDITVYAQLDVYGEDILFAIYDGQLIYWSEEYDTGAATSEYADLVEIYVKAIEEMKEDEEAVQSFCKNMILGLAMPYFNAMGQSEAIDMDALDDCVAEMLKAVTSEEWLAEYMGYSSSKSGKSTVHSFEANLYGAMSGLVEFFEACIEPDMYEELLDAMEDARYEMRDYEMDLDVTTKSGKLVKLEGEMTNDLAELEIRLEVTDAGKTKIDTDEIEDLLRDIANATGSEAIAIDPSPTVAPPDEASPN